MDVKLGGGGKPPGDQVDQGGVRQKLGKGSNTNSSTQIPKDQKIQKGTCTFIYQPCWGKGELI